MKRILVGAVSALLSLAALAATTTPVQLLNPTGSSAGQAIVSNGPSTAPSWQSLTFGILPAMAANTVLGNSSASSAAATAVSMPSCSTSNSGLKYTSGTGFSCGTTFALTSGTLAQFAATTSAQLAGVVSDETGSGALVFAVTPTLTSPNIIGTISGGNAAAGSVGEYPTPTTSSGVSMTSGAYATCGSISLTAGDWDVQGEAIYAPAATTTWNYAVASISTTAAANGGSGTFSQFAAQFGTGQGSTIPTPVVRVSLSATTTVYLTASSNFATSTMTCGSYVRARRVR